MNKFVIITGLSGSGKSSALHALEDLDFYAVDNLPIKLLEQFVELISRSESEARGIALVMDLRDREFLSNFKEIFERVREKYSEIEILFLDSSDDTLLRRFSETRRKHPLSMTSVQEGISKERGLLQELKDLSTVVVDTSEMDVHSLKRRVSELFGSRSKQKLQIRIISFGFKYGVPKNCDILLDVRFLKNPHFVPELKASTGLDTGVQEFIDQDSRFQEFIQKTSDYLHFLIPHYRSEGKKYMALGIGCTGGRHRSVYSAVTLATRLRASLSGDYAISVDHQNIQSL